MNPISSQNQPVEMNDISSLGVDESCEDLWGAEPTCHENTPQTILVSRNDSTTWHGPPRKPLTRANYSTRDRPSFSDRLNLSVKGDATYETLIFTRICCFQCDRGVGDQPEASGILHELNRPVRAVGLQFKKRKQKARGWGVGVGDVFKECSFYPLWNEFHQCLYVYACLCLIKKIKNEMYILSTKRAKKKKKSS